MSEIILYPTETIYGLGVNVFDAKALDALFKLKGRDESKTASWIVRNIADIDDYAVMNEAARQIAEAFLPGQLTLVLEAKETVAPIRSAPDNTIGIRISADPIAQKVIAEYMSEHGVPLTCTSANVSGAPTFPTPGEILQQFGEKAKMITKVVDDGPRKGLASTVVRVVGDEVKVLREGEISEVQIREVLE